MNSSSSVFAPFSVLCTGVHIACERGFDFSLRKGWKEIDDGLWSEGRQGVPAEVLKELPRIAENTVEFLRATARVSCGFRTFLTDEGGRTIDLSDCRNSLYSGLSSPYPYYAELNQIPLEALQLFALANRLEAELPEIQELAA